MLQVAPGVMTSSLMSDLRIDYSSIGIISFSYYWGILLMQIPVGILFDRFSSRNILTISCFACFGGTLLFAVAPNLPFACFGRFLAGVGSSFPFIGMLVLIMRWFSQDRFDYLSGFGQLFVAIGAISGELPMSLFVDCYGWRYAMISLGAIGVIIAIVLYCLVSEDPSRNQQTITKTSTLDSFKEVLNNDQTICFCIYSLIIWGTCIAFAVLWGIPFLVKKLTISTPKAAYMMAFFWVSFAISSPLVGFLSNLQQKRKPLLICASIAGFVCFSVLIFIPVVPIYLVYFCLVGLGFACSGQILTFAMITENNNPKNTALAISLNNMAQILGNVLFQPLIGYLIKLSSSGHLDTSGAPIYTIEDFTFGLTLLPVLLVIPILTSCFFVKETYCKSGYIKLAEEL